MLAESCRAFLNLANSSPQLRRELRAVTGLQEVVRLGRRHGYSFDADELITASSSLDPGPWTTPNRSTGRPGTDVGFFHFEYDMTNIPGLANVIAALPRLEIRPRSIDLVKFRSDYREAD